jgi:hypothetical protein
MVAADEAAGADGAIVTLIYLVAGVSGAGESAASRGLRDLGREAVSLDADTRLCGWPRPHILTVS